jgi:hypothetical protein
VKTKSYKFPYIIYHKCEFCPDIIVNKSGEIVEKHCEKECEVKENFYEN